MRFLALPLVLALSVLLGSCAYRLGDSDRQIPGGYRTVAIPVFTNRSMEAGIETFFTNALVREFERGRVGRVAAKSDAQTTLEGTIDNVVYGISLPVEGGKEGGAFLPPGTILNTEYRINLQTTLRLRRNSDQKVLWEGTFNGERSYQAPQIGIEGVNSSNATYNQSARYQNIQLMATDLMNEAHNRITENF